MFVQFSKLGPLMKERQREVSTMPKKVKHMNERQIQRMRADREELSERIARAMPKDGRYEIRRGVFFNRVSEAGQTVYSVAEPSFCVIAQGSKDILLGDATFHYDPAHYLITTMGLPMTGQVVQASSSRPYLGFRLVLDPAVITSVLVEAGVPNPRGEGQGVTSVDVSPLDIDLLDAVVRLVRLMDRPADYHALSPLIVREIIYRLAHGSQANRLRHLATFGGQAHRMARAVEMLRDSFDKALKIEGVAERLGMSVSGFHAHFKAATAMSPLQFQKQIRLQEARRLMLSENLDAGEAGFRVGYEDQSHFSRDYKRQFGEPPIRDVERLRELAIA
jgi:AraC-like DNA-binding protein